MQATLLLTTLHEILFHNSKLGLQVKHFKTQLDMIYLKHMKIYPQILIINWGREFHLRTSENFELMQVTKTILIQREVTLANIHDMKYCIPIDHPILDDHGVFHPWALSDQLCFEITFAPVNNVVIYSDTTKPPNYKITNLELEYRCISSEFLANEAAGGYQIGCGFLYENIVLHKTFNISKATDAIINEHVNIPRRSMIGILRLFTEVFTDGTRD